MRLLIMFVVNDEIQERIIEFEGEFEGERVDSDNLPLECRAESGVQKRTRNRRIKKDRSGESRG